MLFLKKITLIAVLVPFLLCGLFQGAAFAGPAGANRPSLSAGDLPLSGRFGVASSHLKLYDPETMERELEALAEAGIGWVRCDFAWYDLESEQGQWNWSGADLAVEKAGEYGIEILGILGTSPPWASDGGENDWNYPPNEEHLADWSNYVMTVCSRYRGKVSAWEVWNEQNIDAFWMPEPDSQYYVQILALASQAIRAADPEVTVVMGGVAGLGSGYLDACLQAGAADYVDAIAYHPYPETIGVEGELEEDKYKPKEELCRLLVDFVHWLVSLYSEKDLEIWLTEVGWTTCQESPPGVDYDTQASYMLRTLINYAGTDVDKVFYYNSRDELLNSWDYYGLLENDFTPKDSHGYYATFEEVFGEAVSTDPDAVSFSCSEPSTLEAHCFELPGGDLALAAWKSDDLNDSLTFTVNDPSFEDPLTVDPLTGETQPAPGVSRDAQGRITVTGLPVGKKPVIIRMNVSAPPGPTPQGSTFFFAEGYTGQGFQEYLCLGNTREEKAGAVITYMFADGTTRVQEIEVPAGSRATVDVNGVVGADREVSARVEADRGVVAERPMYFDYGSGWTGGHDAVGITEPATTFYFAEGYTGTGFDEWICVLNPGDAPAGLTFRFQTEEEGEKIIPGGSVPAHSRSSFKVNELLGQGYQASCVLESDQPIVAERPMYFDYTGTGAHHWRGGHCVMGATSLCSECYFAEGTTRSGFEEWITIQNPHASGITVKAVYQFGQGQGEPITKSYGVGAGKRLTFFMPDEVGWEKDVSVGLSSSSTFLAERPMYFDYAGMGASHWQGGHCVVGTASQAAEWFFAEGCTGEGFHEWLCLQNAQEGDAMVEITYYTQEEGALPAKIVTVTAGTRLTLPVNDHAGSGYQLSCRVQVNSGPDIVVERPMYFDCNGRDGGHDVMGYTP